MAKKRKIQPLGEAEMEVLQHVWDLKVATVAQVHEVILKHRAVAYTTVMTLMKKLADKGYLTYEKQGNAYIYSPAQKPEEVRHSILDEVIQKVFKGSPVALVQTLVNRQALSEEESTQIEALIEQLKADNSSTS